MLGVLAADRSVVTYTVNGYMYGSTEAYIQRHTLEKHAASEDKRMTG